MQRLHQDDPSGHILAKNKENIRHICLPGEIRSYRDKVQTQELIEKYVDDLLDPHRLNWTSLEDLEADLGQYGYAGQIGQDPTPPGGGMFKVDHFQMIDVMPRPIEIMNTVRYWDKAATAANSKEKGKGCYTVGVKMSQLANKRWLIWDVKRGKWGTNEREAIIKETAYADGTKVEVWVEQEPGSSGKDSADATIRNLPGFVCKAEKPTGDKGFRADPLSVQVNVGSVLLLRGDWNHDFIEEFRFFPFSTYKDQVDAASGGFTKLLGKKFCRSLTKRRNRD
jgi:predicted phage terminase large subunit-like protein